MSRETNVFKWLSNGGWSAVVKLITILVLAGVIYARQEARIYSIERSVTTWEQNIKELTGELVKTREELVKLRVETAEMRVELKYLAGVRK
jgi:hypothetical protein